MKKILLLLVGVVLLAPTVFFAVMAATSNSDGRPIVFGVWMFFGLPTMLGALYAFFWASKVE